MTPYYSEGGITIYHGDCREILPEVTSGSVALAFFDPPYGLNIAGWDKKLSCLEALPELRRALVAGGSIYATCSAHILHSMMAAIRPDRVIAWGKPNLPLRKHLNDWEWSTEFVLRWVNGERPRLFNKPSGEDARDYWRIAVENGFLNKDRLTHPARKPLALLNRIVSSSTDGGDCVIDPTCGSGTTLVSAQRLGRRAIGIEIEERYCEIAAKRLAQGVLFGAEVSA